MNRQGISGFNRTRVDIVVTLRKGPCDKVCVTWSVTVELVDFQFGGSPVACALGIAVLDVIRNEQLISSAKSVGKCLLDGFKAIMPSHPMMGDVR